MKIQLLRLEDGKSYPVSQDYEVQNLEINFIDFQFIQPIHMEGSIEKILDVLNFKGTLSSQLKQICGRCLAEKVSKFSKSFHLIYDTKNKTEIETLEDLRELLIIDYPMSFICSKNCQGLCPMCGTNLNEKKCNCQLTNRPESLSSWQIAWKKKLGGNQ